MLIKGMWWMARRRGMLIGESAGGQGGGGVADRGVVEGEGEG